MSYLDAIILAIVEGLTEFLPVSSTGHMIITTALLGIKPDDFTKTFTVAIQLGAIVSVVILYWKRFFKTFDFYIKLLIAFIPAAVVGFLLGDTIDAMLERVDVVAYALIAGGIFFLFVDDLFKHAEETGSAEVTNRNAFVVGLFQILAMVIPGISRSAATIIGGLSQKLNKTTAAEFSFFLAVPTMAAATGYKLLKFYLKGGEFTANQVSLLAVGNVFAFIVALIAIRSFISFLTKHGFKWFGYYRIIVGVAILLMYYLGGGLSIV
ncbi:MAG TPA: undecaprenyl-diphosphate phosphatase [Cyclobacteriaceae bacterium]|nr:undecaprenyl-diphosphate phosphatase [Cyclobacteriaceae bacterium]